MADKIHAGGYSGDDRGAQNDRSHTMSWKPSWLFTLGAAWNIVIGLSVLSCAIVFTAAIVWP